MIPTLYFVIGFLIYVAFCMVTFDIYSRKKDGANVTHLMFIYIYYTLLAFWAISVAETGQPMAVVFVETGIYAVACAMMLLHYYNSIILKRDAKKYENMPF